MKSNKSHYVKKVKETIVKLKDKTAYNHLSAKNSDLTTDSLDLNKKDIEILAEIISNILIKDINIQ